MLLKPEEAANADECESLRSEHLFSASSKRERSVTHKQLKLSVFAKVFLSAEKLKVLS